MILNLKIGNLMVCHIVIAPENATTIGPVVQFPQNGCIVYGFEIEMPKPSPVFEVDFFELPQFPRTKECDMCMCSMVSATPTTFNSSGNFNPNEL